MITLVLGGARSGKSEVGERLAAALGPDVTYVATAVPDPADADFAVRIDKHRARRPQSWTTVEVGADLADVLATLDGPVLVDSLGTWVAATADPDSDALCHALTHRAGATVVVSEEVGLGVHPSSEAGRRFRDALGIVNRAVADVADDVLLVVAGRVLPLARA
ncbi:MAG TPA: bifunctional adenosylcobinamide kinase/adenosylcobinamide-phosphate guanylyltransferase [Acidimicrobiales bacterium]|nr:bifunctional adenosylcobinamide kinase/adenosylcobinamide-phosphate guanylyltransferase [Acidimicrobiales bacterium]